jgi:polysaccharide export outer membrane protein
MREAISFAMSAGLAVLCFAFELRAQDAPSQTPMPQTQAGAESAPKPAQPETGDPYKLAAPSQSAPGVDENRFVIGPEDQIEVFIWADPRIGGTFLVRPDGKISMNLLGEVQAAGRTPAALATDVSEMLKQKDIIRRPQVNVKVLQVNSKKFLINGEVMKTGAFPLVVPTRVMDALVNAGGFKDFANKKDIVIIRGNTRLKFNWNDVIKGKKTEQNVYLEHGDIIIVK